MSCRVGDLENRFSRAEAQKVDVSSLLCMCILLFTKKRHNVARKVDPHIKGSPNLYDAYLNKL